MGWTDNIVLVRVMVQHQIGNKSSSGPNLIYWWIYVPVYLDEFKIPQDWLPWQQGTDIWATKFHFKEKKSK